MMYMYDHELSFIRTPVGYIAREDTMYIFQRGFAFLTSISTTLSKQAVKTLARLCVCASREGRMGTPLNNHKTIGFPSNTRSNPLKNLKVTKPEFNVGPSLVRQRNAIYMAFRWRADVGPLIVVFRSSLSSSTQNKKRCQRRTPLAKLSGSEQDT